MKRKPAGQVYSIHKPASTNQQEDCPKEVIFPGGQGCSLEEANRIIAYLQNERARWLAINQAKGGCVINKKEESAAGNQMKTKTSKKCRIRGGRLLFLVKPSGK